MASTFSLLPPIQMEEASEMTNVAVSVFISCPWKLLQGWYTLFVAHLLGGTQLQGQLVSLFLCMQATFHRQCLLPHMFMSGFVQSSDFAGR